VSTAEFRLPFENTKEVEVILLLAGGGAASETSIKHAVTLQATIDGTSLLGMKPDSVSVTEAPPKSIRGQKQKSGISYATLRFSVQGEKILPKGGHDTASLGYKEEHITLALKITADTILD
jgi:hypothetical protein